MDDVKLPSAATRAIRAVRVLRTETSHTRMAVFNEVARLTTARCAFGNLPNSKKSHWGKGVTAEDAARGPDRLGRRGCGRPVGRRAPPCGGQPRRREAENATRENGAC